MYIFLAVTFPSPPHCNLYIIFEEYITSKCVKKKGKGKKKQKPLLLYEEEGILCEKEQNILYINI